jgi:hypothetical protein
MSRTTCTTAQFVSMHAVCMHRVVSYHTPTATKSIVHYTLAQAQLANVIVIYCEAEATEHFLRLLLLTSLHAL